MTTPPTDPRDLVLFTVRDEEPRTVNALSERLFGVHASGSFYALVRDLLDRGELSRRADGTLQIPPAEPEQLTAFNDVSETEMPR